MVTSEPSATPVSSTLVSREQDWADISDDEGEESSATVKVDSLDLTSLSLNDKNKSGMIRRK